MNRRTAFGLLLLITFGALALRLPSLGQRPMHSDEGVNALKFRSLWESNEYRYDPHEFHGPLLPYATRAVVAARPAPDFASLQESDLRLVPLLFFLGLLLLLPLVWDGLGKPEALVAAALLALSPAFVFYSQYYIHEMALVFFTFLFLAASWRFQQSGRLIWALLAGAGLGFMHATKETFVLALAALAFAIGLAWFWTRRKEGKEAPLRGRFNWKAAAAGVAVAATVSTVLFTSFFSNWSGPVDSIRTYLPWLSRAGGDSPHIHPWHFYARRLAFYQLPGEAIWTEGLVLLLAAVGAARAFFGGTPAAASRWFFARVVALYGLALAAVYSAISYKTPWCLLGFYHALILTAGIGATALFRRARPLWARAVLAVILAAGAGHLGWQAWRATHEASASRYNPYVYAHTSPDLANLVLKVNALAEVHPDGREMLIKVMAPGRDYWPLPWLLRSFPRIGYWDHIPEDPFAPVMIVSAQFDAGFDRTRERTHLMTGYFQLRPETFLELYVEIELWKKYVMSRPPPEEDDEPE